MKAQITEVFKSFQGEGLYIGAPQVFVRFFGCSLSCSYCDTPLSKDPNNNNSKKMDVPSLLKDVLDLSFGVHSVSLTGGEPLEQTEFLKIFIPVLRKEKLKIYLETNGINWKSLKEIIDIVDIISMDFKLPGSVKENSYLDEHQKFLSIANQKEVFVKTVISSDVRIKEVEQSARLISEVNRDIFLILQPNGMEPLTGAIQKCMDLQKECSAFLGNIRIIPQMHKYLQIR